MSSWDECLDEFLSHKITPDKDKFKSLIETAQARLEVTNKEINAKTCNFIFEDYYSSILELLEALVLSAGFNVKNHFCLGYYLRDVLKKDNLFIAFDELRYKRNSLIYQGKRMELSVCESAILKSKKLFEELHALIREKIW
jgi:uncharacterized protein (UPF0332 family)